MDSPETQRPLETKPRNTGIPQADHFPIIYNPNLDEFSQTSDEQRADFKSREVDLLSEQLNNLPVESFDEMRDGEMLRLSPYFDAFADIYGFDLRSIARTRMQLSQTVMNSSVLFLQRMFDEDTKSEQLGNTFFEGRMKGGNFDFNANGNTVIDGYTMTFSVLKRGSKDVDGKFEVDYPAFSLPREVISELNKWNQETNPGQPLEDNPLLSVGSELMSRRVHDWIHSSFLYDTEAESKAFLQWSKDSYFVTHFLDDPGQINYELMSNHMHFRVWQHIFEQNPEAKQQVIEEARTYLQLVDRFAAWSGNDKMANFLGYIGMRGVFDIIRHDDAELNQSLSDFERFLVIKGKIPDGSRKFLDLIYREDEEYYFREGTEQKIDLKQILREYVDGLTAEAKQLRLIGENNALKSGVNFLEEYEKLPESLKKQIQDKNLKTSAYDARLFSQLNENVEKLKYVIGSEAAQFLIGKVEVDDQGLFYVKVNRDEVDMSEADTVKQQKSAMVVQIPYGETNQRTLVVKTANDLLSSQQRAQSEIVAGDLITINTQNQSVARRILQEAKNESGEFDIERFFTILERDAKKGLVALSDAYPYDVEKAFSVYQIDPENVTTDPEGRKIVKPGFYSTYGNDRPAAGINGPISMDAMQDPNTRRRILKGAVVQNHIQNEGELDIFPVHYESFDTFYAASDRKDLPQLRVNSQFSATYDNRGINDGLTLLLSTLESVNDKKIYGFRGKPQIPTFATLSE